MDKSHPASEQPEPLPDEGALEGDDALNAQLVAYLDGELNPQESEDLESKINLDPKLRSRVEALRQTWALLDHLPRPEPSPRFTERTMEKIEPVPGQNSRGATAKSAVRRTVPTSVLKTGTKPARSSSSTSSMESQPVTSRSRWSLILLGSFLVLGLATTAGYFIRAAVVTPIVVEKSSDEPKIEDSHLLRNFRLYQHVNDMKFLKDLDHPELFGDSSTGS